jgi:Bacterial Ig-like domain (group 3)
VKISRAIAAVAGLAVLSSALIVAVPASADVKTFPNAIASDPQIRTVTLEITPKTLNVSLTIDDLQFQPSLFSFYLMPADTVANAASTVERVFRAANPDQPGDPWGTGGYIRGTSGPDQPGPYAGSFTLTTAGLVSTATLTVSDPLALPWSGSTWIAVTFVKDGTYYNAGVIEPDGLHGVGPVTDLSIPTTVNLALVSPSQTFGRAPTAVTGSVVPAAPGTVELLDGATSLGSTAVTEAAPSFAFALPPSLSAGSHSLHAIFTPTTSRFAVGASAIIVLQVKKQTTVTLKLSHSKQHFTGKRVKATVTVTGRHAGKVRLYDGKHKLKTLTLRKGSATYAFSSKLSKKKHVITAVYLPKDTTTYASSTSKKVTLKVVK